MPLLTSKSFKQASDKKFLCELACDKEYLEEMLDKLSSHTHANKLDYHKEITSKVQLSKNIFDYKESFIIVILKTIKKVIHLKYLIFQAQEALNYLKERKEFWAQQQPERPEFPEEIGNLQSKTPWNALARRPRKKSNKFK